MATVGQRPEFLNREETLNALLEPGFNPKNVVYLPPAARAFISATNRTEAKILASKFSAHHATMTVEANQPSMLIVAQSFYHPWNAYVDGKAAQLWRANHAYQGLEVPAGQHEVTLAYNDPYFHLGALVSGTVLLSTIVAWFCKRRILWSARH